MVLSIPSTLIAVAQWCSCMAIVMNRKRRFHGWREAVICAVCLAAQCLTIASFPHVNRLVWIIAVLTSILLIDLTLFCCCILPWRDICYLGLHAYLFGEFISTLEWQCYTFYFSGSSDQIGLRIAFMLLVYLILCTVFFMLMRRQMRPETMLDISSAELVSTTLIVAGVFILSNLSLINESTPFSSNYEAEASTLRTMVSMGGAAMLYAHLIQRTQIRTQRELDAVQQILENQYRQYEQSKAAIELINYRYHDLKQQIAVLREEKNPKKRADYLDQMEQEIRQYVAQNKTGNSVLDTLLTGKSTVCEKKNITFNCVADGTLLSFMDVMDICSIVGNALDNAIESELRVEDTQKRLIHAAIFQQKEFLILRFENYAEEEVVQQDGLKSSEKNTETGFQGYRLKSIRHTVEKYDGAMNLQWKDHWAELKILIPLRK
ncbi:MAG: GHKL domain-containing protein [Eubacteriales bacterium]|nr:GHKL domain-containing protein [Eubacteriales bacterium]